MTTQITTETLGQFLYVKTLLGKLQINYSIDLVNGSGNCFLVEFKNTTQAYSFGVIIGSLINKKYTGESIENLIDSELQKGGVL